MREEQVKDPAYGRDDGRAARAVVIRQLRSQGLEMKQIAVKLNISVEVVRYIMRLDNAKRKQSERALLHSDKER